MWSDHDTIRPHAKYQRREQPGSRSKKKKLRLIIDGIFVVVVVVVVVVVLEAVGWIRGGYAYPVLDGFFVKNPILTIDRHRPVRMRPTLRR
jgi:hypothetical protein